MVCIAVSLFLFTFVLHSRNYSKHVEVIGRVVDSETIQEFKATLFGEDFDLETYDQFVEVAHTKHRALFD